MFIGTPADRTQISSTSMLDLPNACLCHFLQEVIMVPTPILEKVFSRDLLDVLIRAGVIAVLVIFCFQIFSYPATVGYGSQLATRGRTSL